MRLGVERQGTSDQIQTLHLFEEAIITPYKGVVQQILVKKKIYEWKPLFIIKRKEAVLYSVRMGGQ